MHFFLIAHFHKHNNVYAEEVFRYGDVDQVFSDAAEIFETVTRTGYQEHLYVEPHGVVAVPEGDRMTVYASTQMIVSYCCGSASTTSLKPT